MKYFTRKELELIVSRKPDTFLGNCPFLSPQCLIEECEYSRTEDFRKRRKCSNRGVYEYAIKKLRLLKIKEIMK